MLTNGSSYLKTKLPAIPPMPPKATNVALQRARFHWPRMLFACQVMHCGMLELAPAQVKKTPAYWAPTLVVQPIMARPMIVRMAFPMITGPRMWYRSPIHAVPNITMPANASAARSVKAVLRVHRADSHGGATRHCAAPTLNPMPPRRMIGKKYAKA